MTTREARELFDYGSWANARVLAAVEALPEEQVDATAASSFSSIRATAAHIVATEWIWMRRWLGDRPAVAPEWAGGAPLGELRAHLASVERERAAYLDRLTDRDLEAPISYRGLDGQAFSLPLGKLMQHVVNHGTYHRGQLATQFRQLGYAAPSTDLSRWLREAR